MIARNGAVGHGARLTYSLYGFPDSFAAEPRRFPLCRSRSRYRDSWTAVGAGRPLTPRWQPVFGGLGATAGCNPMFMGVRSLPVALSARACAVIRARLGLRGIKVRAKGVSALMPEGKTCVTRYDWGAASVM